MSYFQIPENLRPGPPWHSDADGSAAIWLADVPELRDLLESVILLPDCNRRLAKALRNNKQITHLAWATGYTSQFMFDCIATIETLERLGFGYLRASDISGLANLKRLQYLSIDSLSSASTLEPLMQLQDLISLGIGISTKITSLEDFSDNSLNSLRALFIGASSERVITVDSLDPLGSLYSLEYLMVACMRSKDRSLAGLLKLRNLKALEVDKRAQFSKVDIEALESAGVVVTQF